MSNGFGFSFPHNGNGDGDGDNFDLGDILNQFGQMLSGMGTSMNNRAEGEAVNFDLAARIARQRIGEQPAASAGDATAVAESLRLADLWIDEATDLPTSPAQPAAWNAGDWLTHTMPMWKRLVNPVAEHMGRAQLESMPEQAREMMGPIAGMMNSMNSMSFGMKLGHALGDLAQQALTGTDFGLPVAPQGTAAILPHNATAISKDLGVASQEVLVFIAAREAARQRLFTHVPWLVERIVSSVEEYAAGLEIDTSHLEEVARSLDLESSDPQQLQEKLNELQGMDLSPRIGTRNSLASSRLETLLALVEGWVDVVVTAALSDRIPSTSQLTEAWARRRATGGSAERAFANIVGIELSAPKVREAAELWRRVDVAVGTTRRDAVWDHPDFLPTAEDIDSPAEFIDSLLDDAPDTSFDEELAKLEEDLRNGDDER
ncbi:zinc-dependent metalloprotease [Corynebacterium liangguodongii]|uniref:Hydrolase n=1 Tax=Corynebacterium liangguodongii TaxID=2079535 RepID=A0A2S0WCQ8_9CORY|nr:zinc-dependent metalloprotease [Corynebacterium liangguodongii]AWB83567.1 hydrolase [Corynebacterium liangguodongii]PWC00344.1 hydrolase [Corynebacterium liangguodongii]